MINLNKCINNICLLMPSFRSQTVQITAKCDTLLPKNIITKKYARYILPVSKVNFEARKHRHSASSVLSWVHAGPVQLPEVSFAEQTRIFSERVSTCVDVDEPMYNKVSLGRQVL